jgi:hypothetical protein
MDSRLTVFNAAYIGTIHQAEIVLPEHVESNL